MELAPDSSAAAALYERHSSRVFGYCLSHLGRREDAEDAVQTTFLHAVRGLRRGVVPTTEVAWLLGIARNVCLSRWESAGRRRRLESPCDPYELDRGTAAPEGSREELIGVENALRQLPEQQRRAVVLRDWRGLSYEEVAAELNVSKAAVETLIFRGRNTLAALLREEPQATRRRLRSLGDLGSLLAAVKAAFTGSAAATKIAVAAATAVAISGTGALVVPSLKGGEPVPLETPGATPAAIAPAASLVVRERPLNAGRRPRVTRVAPRVTAPRSARPATPQVTPQVTPAATPAVDTSPTASAAPTAEPARTPASAEPGAAPTPRQSQPAEAAAPASPAASRGTTDVVPVVTTAVNETVNTLLPNVPLELPALPLPPVQLPDTPATELVVEVVETIPAVVAVLPVLLPPLFPPQPGP